MTTLGPVQVIIFGFERTDQFRGQVLEELSSLRGRGLIRLLDLFLALKSPGGDIVAVETKPSGHLPSHLILHD